MNKEIIIENAKKDFASFKKNLNGVDYELRGMFNSELLMITSIINNLDINLVIESGRARGHSTNILAKNLVNKKIISIDFDESSEDVKYSEKRLEKYNNLKLIYGDSNIIIPKNITEECAIVIDGPKGEDALILTSELLKNKLVKCVFIHDLHKNTFDRDIFDIIYNNTFSSDDVDYVESFRSLDNNCWNILKGTGEEPYIRKNKKINSYASTIVVVFNKESTINKVKLENFIERYNSKKVTFKMFLQHNINNNGIIFKTLLYVNKFLKI